METQPILAAWAKSSSDATQISNTIKGLVVAGSSVIILVISLYLHIQVSSTDVLQFGTELGTTTGFIWFVAGLLLKGIHWLAKEKSVSFSVPAV